MVFLMMTLSRVCFSEVNITCENGLAGLGVKARGHVVRNEGMRIRALVPLKFQDILTEPLQAFNKAGFIAAKEIEGAKFYRGSLIGSGLMGAFQEKAVVWFIERKDEKTQGIFSDLFALSFDSKSWHLGYAHSVTRENNPVVSQKDFEGFIPRLGTYLTDTTKSFILGP